MVRAPKNSYLPNMGWQALVAKVVDLGVGIVLVLAGALKIADPSTLASHANILGLGAFPTTALEFVLPPLELAAGGAMVLGFSSKRSRIAIIAALFVFIAVLVTLAHRGAQECGCLGSFGDSSIEQAIVRNAIMIVALCAATIHSRHRS